MIADIHAGVTWSASHGIISTYSVWFGFHGPAPAPPLAPPNETENGTVTTYMKPSAVLGVGLLETTPCHEIITTPLPDLRYHLGEEAEAETGYVLLRDTDLAGLAAGSPAQGS